MRFMRVLLYVGVLSVCLQGQAPQSGDALAELKGLPPRATAGDYQFQVQAGAVTIAAEFKGHSIPTMQGPLNSEEYVAVEIGVFGAPGARATLSLEHFSLIINRRKSPLPAKPSWWWPAP